MACRTKESHYKSTMRFSVSGESYIERQLAYADASYSLCADILESYSGRSVMKFLQSPIANALQQ